MRKDVIISIHGKPGEEDEGNLELITAGRLYRKNSEYYISYKESALTGMQGVTTTLKVEADRVTLIRSGSAPSHMIFKPGQKHYGLYDMDGEAMTVAICARRVRQNLNDDGGDLEIDYSVEINNMLASENQFRIHVREPGIQN